MVGHADGELMLVGSSFGAISVALSLAELGERVRAVVLWQPVLDLRQTFLEPTLPRGRELYTDRTSLRDNGFLDIEGRFRLGAALFDEFATVDPRAAFLASTQPALVIHGDADDHASHDIARDTAREHPNTSWHPIPGAGHGFVEPPVATEVVAVTADWLTAR